MKMFLNFSCDILLRNYFKFGYPGYGFPQTGCQTFNLRHYSYTRSTGFHLEYYCSARFDLMNKKPSRCFFLLTADFTVKINLLDIFFYKKIITHIFHLAGALIVTKL